MTEALDPVDKARFDCVDCAVSTFDNDEYYMVQDAVWANAGMQPHGGMLCIGCLETRIGRILAPADFTDCPVNHGCFPQGPRLLDRLGCCPLPIPLAA